MFLRVQPREQHKIVFYIQGGDNVISEWKYSCHRGDNQTVVAGVHSAVSERAQVKIPRYYFDKASVGNSDTYS